MFLTLTLARWDRFLVRVSDHLTQPRDFNIEALLSIERKKTHQRLN
mgnify:CR=1 FL=1